MPKRIKSSEDIARLKEIKHSVMQLQLEVKTAKQTLKSLKAERNLIKAKYVQLPVSA